MNEEFEKEFNKLSEKDKREVNNLIRFMQEKKYHDKQYEELLNQYIEMARDFDKLQSNWNSLRECIIGIIDGAREELNTIMQGDDLEYINQCSREFEVIRKNLEIVLDKMNELEGKDNNE